ncbi:MAG: DNA repair protein RecO C-terminal domain-containing protein [Muribaculaceae bacterium]|nr:DNA repair protein RecO C-terminal domain-containing protein [Muribaculaceae bacterium]
MYESLQGVVLNVVKYNERHNIVHIYTDRRGLMGFLVAQGATRGARMRNAMLMPLSLVSLEARLMPGRDLAMMHDLRRTVPLTTLYADPRKNAIAMFMAELITHTIREHERNEGLWRYITTAVELLEALERGFANFHICFLYHLGAFLGIQPDMSTYADGYWFDMTEGVFVHSPRPGHEHLRPEEARVLRTLSRMTMANMMLFRFTRDERNRVLDTCITYYRLHHSAIGTLRSPAILKQLFD